MMKIIWQIQLSPITSDFQETELYSKFEKYQLLILLTYSFVMILNALKFRVTLKKDI